MLRSTFIVRCIYTNTLDDNQIEVRIFTTLITYSNSNSNRLVASFSPRSTFKGHSLQTHELMAEVYHKWEFLLTHVVPSPFIFLYKLPENEHADKNMNNQLKITSK